MLIASVASFFQVATIFLQIALSHGVLHAVITASPYAISMAARTFILAVTIALYTLHVSNPALGAGPFIGGNVHKLPCRAPCELRCYSCRARLISIRTSNPPAAVGGAARIAVIGK